MYIYRDAANTWHIERCVRLGTALSQRWRLSLLIKWEHERCARFLSWNQASLHNHVIGINVSRQEHDRRAVSLCRSKRH